MVLAIISSSQASTSNIGSVHSQRGPTMELMSFIAASIHEDAQVCSTLTAIHELIELDLSIHEGSSCHWIVIERIHGLLQLRCALIMRRQTCFLRVLIVGCNLRFVAHDLCL